MLVNSVLIVKNPIQTILVSVRLQISSHCHALLIQLTVTDPGFPIGDAIPHAGSVTLHFGRVPIT